ncbi:polyprotein [Operophtera brumata]|uniref:Polyprotein n=1 Tax=Operophtera brumata TaxID=104452 RepID=A0A0L7KVC5_OPEBR|nr:polyprotein [Operophtera brumata]
MTYGSQNFLTVLGSFESSITNSNGALIGRATFYVVKNGTRNLLGKETAIKLGLGVNAIDSNAGLGEEVYVKEVDKVNKLSSPFYDVPHTVVTKNGNDVEIENDDTGQRLRRNIVHLKRVEGHVDGSCVHR